MILVLLLACSPSAEDIAKAIGSENPVMREDGAKIAQNFADPVVEAALVTTLSDPSIDVRLNAIESLAEIEASTAGPALVERLNVDESSRVRRAAADALGRLKTKEAVPALILYVQGFGPNDHEQLAGVWALGNIGGEGLDGDAKTAVLATLSALRDATADPWVRYVTSSALRTLK
jgi:hypothetical protein